MADHVFCDDIALYNYDCRKVLPVLRDGLFSSIVTDPPYELGFMGKDWDSAGASYDPGVWGQALRVLKPGGYLLAFGGTRTYHRMVCAVEDAGFEIRDSLHWIYGNGFPKGKTCLKPAHEPIVLAQKPYRGSIAANVLAHGTGALDIDGCRVSGGVRPARTNEMSRSGLTGTGGAATYGSFAVRGSIAVGETTEGRWPPNVLLTHSAGCEMTGTCRVRGSRIEKPSAVLPDDRAAYGGGLGGARPARGIGDADGLEEVGTWVCMPGCPVAGLNAQSGVLTSDTGGASRFFPVTAWSAEYDIPFLYQGKAPKKERPRLEDGTQHPTVKPLALMRWLVRLITPPGGIVLDMFCGTGPTLQAARLEGFKSVGMDDWDKAYQMARKRLAI